MFLRLNPGEFTQRDHPIRSPNASPHQADLRRATQIFENLRAAELSDRSERSQHPALVARPVEQPTSSPRSCTRKYGSLTYARSSNDPEDVSFFDRRRHAQHRRVRVDPDSTSARHFFSEDDGLDFDITSLRHPTPRSRRTVSGSTAGRDVDQNARAHARHDDAPARRAARRCEASARREFGRLLHLRVVGQNNILISLPAGVPGHGARA